MSSDIMTPRSASSSGPALNTLETDVLVIGGGFAGCFAAINAAETGARVLMAVKGRTGRSGLTPWANSWFVFKDTRGVTREQYLQQFVLSGEYLNNMDFVEILMAESHDRYLEVSSWGAQTGREYYYQPGTVTRSIEVVGSGDAMRKKAVASGVQLLERVMITSLIKPEDKVVGAVGFHMESGHPYAILAKATIMCAGPASFKPLGMGYPCSAATADGDAMAYRVGAEISGKEFNDAHPARGANPLAEHEASPMLPATEMGGGPPSAPGAVEKLEGRGLGLRIQSAYAVSTGGLVTRHRECRITRARAFFRRICTGRPTCPVSGPRGMVFARCRTAQDTRGSAAPAPAPLCRGPAREERQPSTQRQRVPLRSKRPGSRLCGRRCSIPCPDRAGFRLPG